MALEDKVFAYCERGIDPGFWAEPLNALTNAAFLIAAYMAWRLYSSKAKTLRPVVVFHIVLVAVIGVGSFVFHTVATEWASLADVIPIGVFVLTYLGYALRVLVGLSVAQVAVMLAGFVGASYFGSVYAELFNGSAMYAPALLALLGIGGWLHHKKHPQGKLVLGATGVFVLSLALRSIDRQVCPVMEVAGHPLGSHVAWHCLNAVVLYLLLRAMVLSSFRITANR